MFIFVIAFLTIWHGKCVIFPSHLNGFIRHTGWKSAMCGGCPSFAKGNGCWSNPYRRFKCRQKVEYRHEEKTCNPLKQVRCKAKSCIFWLTTPERPKTSRMWQIIWKQARWSYYLNARERKRIFHMMVLRNEAFYLLLHSVKENWILAKIERIILLW